MFGGPFEEVVTTIRQPCQQATPTPVASTEHINDNLPNQANLEPLHVSPQPPPFSVVVRVGA